MQFFEENVKRYAEEKNMIQPGDHIAAAVSGGMDSMALLFWLAAQQKRLGVSISAVHIDHMLRGAESYQDLCFVEAFCRARAIPFFGQQVHVQKTPAGKGIQEAARQARYAALADGMRRLGANKLATAHHADDQMETVLMQLVKGGHAKTGMPLVRSFADGQLIRPFLSSSKEDISAYVAAQSIPYREDPSNEKSEYTRNRFRQQVLPFFKQENPAAAAHFSRYAEEGQQDEALLQSMAEKKLAPISRWSAESVSLQIKPFLEVPLPLQRRAIHLILSYLYHGKTAFSFLHIQQIQQLLQSAAPSGKVSLPSHFSASKLNGHCVFTRESGEKCKEEPKFLYENMQAYWKGAGTFTVKAAGSCPDGAVCFRLKKEAPLPLCIRARQDGDRIQVKGLNGSKKVARLFIDEKVPLACRENIPVVTDADQSVLWIPGMRKSIHEGDGPLLLIYEKE